MSLPWTFDIKFDTIPAEVPYLYVPVEAAAQWRDRLVDGRPKVGIAWAGSKTLEDDDLRSIAFEQLAPLLAYDDVEWVSLQKGESARSWTAARPRGQECIEECQDLLDTAGLIMNLDLVISVDTVIAHLAGALGQPVWLLNRFPSEWRWGTDGERSAWYPTMRIFRQHQRGDWSSVVRNVVAGLQSMGNGGVRDQQSS
jgi:ADP-heptose:LPS heptosyltransferase